MLRHRLPIRPLAVPDRDDALAFCARDRAGSVFVAARIAEGALRQTPGAVLGHYTEGTLDGLAWLSANVVPLGLREPGLDALAARIARQRRQSASIFGPIETVAPLWERLEPSWGPARAVRARQPLLTTRTRPSQLGVTPDPGVRVARLEELDVVQPAAARMFTEEIGYAPYSGSDRGYRASLASLLRAGHTFVKVEDGEVVFKADIGSLALGDAQVQGVWLHPRLRGQGLAVPAMAAVVELILDGLADEVSLYVNDFNTPARATYARCGFREVGTFTTILL